MERLPAYWEEVFSPACLLKEPLFLRTFFQKSHTIESAQPTDSHWYYTTSLPYSFNGKEKDWESGFHYYGARYYWSETLTGWLSVDPMADKYPSISPYAYCAWNPVKLVDPDGKDVRIIKNDKNKTIIIKANFYYSRKNLGSEADVFLSGFKNAINSWESDIKKALEDQSLGVAGYSVTFDFKFYNRNNPIKEAEEDPIGNSLTNDVDYYADEAVVTNNKHLKTNLPLHSRGEEIDPVFYSTTDMQGTLKHEIGHFWGLYDRYENGRKHAPPIENDLMGKDPVNCGNAVEPFKRVWRSAGLDTKGYKNVLINHYKNREVW